MEKLLSLFVSWQEVGRERLFSHVARVRFLRLAEAMDEDALHFLRQGVRKFIGAFEG